MDTNTDEQRRLVRLLDTLPERLALARSSRLPHHDFLEMLLTDEVARRDRQSAARRAKAAHLDPQMQLHAWDDSAAIIYDQQLWAELTSLRFLADAYNVLILQADRRTPPHRLNHHHQQPRATRDPDHDGRPTPCPVRHGPAAIRGLRTRRRGRVLPATPETPTRKAGQFGRAELTSTTIVGHHHHTARDRKQPVPYSWQNGGPITLAGDTPVRTAGTQLRATLVTGG
jgi:hypothetical protein